MINHILLPESRW